MKIQRVGVVLGFVALAALGCAEPVAIMVPSRPLAIADDEESYEPMYYDEHVVYYDAAGMPFYYVDGVQKYVSRKDVSFDVFAVDYRDNENDYRQWEQRAREHKVERREHVAEMQRKTRRRF